jgi:carboxyl-terminal processing protease
LAQALTEFFSVPQSQTASFFASGHNRIMRKLSLFLLLWPAFAVAQDDSSAPVQPDAAADAAKAAAALPADQPDAVPLEEIQRYVSVYRAIKDAYVDPISDKNLMRAALRGLLSDLDPHSAYLEKSAADNFNEEATGSYVGVGVELEMSKDRSLTVVSPIDGSPAAKAGIRSGDVISAIDGKPVTATDVDNASSSLRGPPGTTVKLTLLREGEKAPREVALVRAAIKLDSVSGKLLEPGYGYLRISSFQTDTGAATASEIAALEHQANGNLRGLVLDLRSNPGGLLDAAIAAADTMLDDGVIVSTRGRLVNSNTVYRAKHGDLLAGAPMVALIDGGTASAAEVLAGALHDHKRALLMGSRSFGKGSIQSVVSLPNGDAVKLTTGRYFTPSGESIQAHGIVPDIALHGDGDSGRGLREQDLPGHLTGGEEDDDGYALGEVLDGGAPIAAALAQLKKETAKVVPEKH